MTRQKYDSINSKFKRNKILKNFIEHMTLILREYAYYTLRDKKIRNLRKRIGKSVDKTEIKPSEKYMPTLQLINNRRD